MVCKCGCGPGCDCCGGESTGSSLSLTERIAAKMRAEEKRQDRLEETVGK